MSKRLIGYGYTNANGVATLDYDANGNALQSSGYVGQGVGEIDISASATVDGSTFVSEPYEVHDCIFYDGAVNGNKNDDWTTISKLHRYDTYTSYEGSAFNNTRIKVNSSENLPMGEYCVEFTVLENTNGRLYYHDGNAISIDLSVGHWRVLNTSDGKITPYLDGQIQTSLIKTYNYSAQTMTIGFSNGNNTALLKFKDFEVYPI